MDFSNKCHLIRIGCTKVSLNSEHVQINQERLQEFVKYSIKNDYDKFDSYECHYQGQSLLDYIFVLDSLNFCFWPSTWEYDNLANALKKVLDKDQNAFKPQNLLKLDLETLANEFFDGNSEFPLLRERLRILHEISHITLEYFSGEFSNIIEKANKSCVKLLNLLTFHFPNFQDHVIWKGQQIQMCKRSQIMIGDLHAAGFLFDDIHELTMFPDYRVPQILYHHGILEYSNELKQILLNKQEVPHGHIFEVEIRANTVVAVEYIKKEFQNHGYTIYLIDSKNFTSIEIDWILWQMGESIKDEIFPHHRTLSIYY